MTDRKQQQQEVQAFVQGAFIHYGWSAMDAIGRSTKVLFANSDELDTLHKTIKSKAPLAVKRAIILHDIYLIGDDTGLMKGTQFKQVQQDCEHKDLTALAGDIYAGDKDFCNDCGKTIAAV